MKNIALASLAALVVAAPAVAADFAGPRIEAHAGWDRVQSKLRNGATVAKGHDDGVIYGAGIGYDVRSNNLVFGIEAGIDDSTTKECVSSGTQRVCASAGRDIEAGFRVGTVLNPTTLLYAKVAYANVRIGTRYTNSALPATNFRDRDNQDGVRVGAGVESQLSPNTYVKAEYRYTDYNNYDIGATSVGLSRHQVIAGIGYRF